MKKKTLNCLKNLESVKKRAEKLVERIENESSFKLYNAVIFACGGYLYDKLPKYPKDIDIQKQKHTVRIMIKVLEKIIEYYKKDIKKWEDEIKYGKLAFMEQEQKNSGNHKL